MVQFVFRTKEKNMNYARAAGGKLTTDKILRDIDSQSEIELGRHLDPSEKNLLFSRFTMDVVKNSIDQVCIYNCMGYHISISI